MTDSILLTVKKMLGIAEEYHAFDIDIITNINSVFLTLNQLGVGPKDPYQIAGVDEVWTDFVDSKTVPGIQTYIYLKTRLLFDPPTNSFLVENVNKQISELEFRMNVQVDTKYPEEEEPSTPIEPDDSEEMVELTPEEVKFIYENVIKKGDVSALSELIDRSDDDWSEITPDEVREIYKNALNSAAPTITTMGLREESLKEVNTQTLKSKLSRIRNRVRHGGGRKHG